MPEVNVKKPKQKKEQPHEDDKRSGLEKLESLAKDAKVKEA